MKKLSILLLAIITLSSCTKEVKKSKSTRNIVVGDTIATGSGLKYILLKEGSGRKIEEGSKVSIYTDLYLNDDKNVFWTSTTAKDSLFTFILGTTSLITGFNELHTNLFEGDEVVAIIPYQLAYGPRERRGIPAKSTLIYDPLVIKSVSEPRDVIADTLFTIVKEQSVKKAMTFYEDVLNSDKKNKFHTSLNLMPAFLQNLNKDSLYVEVETLSKFFLKKSSSSEDKQQFSYYYIASLETQGRIKEGIALIEPLAEQDVNQSYWVNYLKLMKNKLKKEK